MAASERLGVRQRGGRDVEARASTAAAAEQTNLRAYDAGLASVRSASDPMRRVLSFQHDVAASLLPSVSRIRMHIHGVWACFVLFCISVGVVAYVSDVWRVDLPFGSPVDPRFCFRCASQQAAPALANVQLHVLTSCDTLPLLRYAAQTWIPTALARSDMRVIVHLARAECSDVVGAIAAKHGLTVRMHENIDGTISSTSLALAALDYGRSTCEGDASCACTAVVRDDVFVSAAHVADRFARMRGCRVEDLDGRRGRGATVLWSRLVEGAFTDVRTAGASAGVTTTGQQVMTGDAGSEPWAAAVRISHVKSYPPTDTVVVLPADIPKLTVTSGIALLTPAAVDMVLDGRSRASTTSLPSSWEAALPALLRGADVRVDDGNMLMSSRDLLTARQRDAVPCSVPVLYTSVSEARMVPRHDDECEHEPSTTVTACRAFFALHHNLQQHGVLVSKCCGS